MTGSGTITDDVWRILFDLRTELSAFFIRVARLPHEVIEDCMSDAMVDVVSTFDPIAVATEANRIYVKEETIIGGMLKQAMQKRVSQAQYHTRKMISDDTPIGEEDGDMRLRDLFVGRQNGAERVENYAEWRMFSRKGGCPLTASEIEDLFGFNTNSVER